MKRVRGGLGWKLLRLAIPGAVTLGLVGALVVADASAVSREEAERQLEQAEEAYRRLVETETAGRPGYSADVHLGDEVRYIESLIARARDHFGNRRYDHSYKFSSTALDRIRKLGQELLRLEQRLRFYERLADRNREVLELLRRRARLDQVDQKTARMLDMATDSFHRALAANGRGELILAFKLMEQTNDLVRKVMRALGGGRISPERLADDLDRTDDIVENIREAVGASDSPEIQAVLERASVVQREAIASYEDGNFDFARRLTLRARTLARLALRLTQNAPATEAERTLIHTDDLIERYEEKIRESGNAEAESLLEEAIALQGEAWDLYNDDEIAAALTKARAAAKLVTAANHKAGSVGP